MKKITQLLLLIIFTISASFSQNNNKHFGEWEGTDKSGKTASLVLGKTNHVILKIDNEIMGGKDFVVNGVNVEMKYEIDYSKNPIHIDFIIYEQGNKVEKGRLKGIIRFISEEKMEFCVGIDSERPQNFEDNKDNTIILKKIQ